MIKLTFLLATLSVLRFTTLLIIAYLFFIYGEPATIKIQQVCWLVSDKPVGLRWRPSCQVLVCCNDAK